MKEITSEAHKKIIISLLNGDKESYSELARELGYSKMWIKKKFEELERMGIVYFKQKGYKYSLSLKRDKVKIVYEYESIIKKFLPFMIIGIADLIVSIVIMNPMFVFGGLTFLVPYSFYTSWKLIKSGEIRKIFYEEKESKPSVY